MSERFLKMSLAVSGLAREMRRLKLEGMKEFNLKGEQTMLLVVLEGSPQGLKFQELVKILDLDPALISRNLKKLTETGFVLKVGEEGRYKALYQLSDSGADAAQKISRTIDEMEKKVRREISESDMDIFYTTARRLKENMEILKTGKCV